MAFFGFISRSNFGTMARRSGSYAKGNRTRANGYKRPSGWKTSAAHAESFAAAAP